MSTILTIGDPHIQLSNMAEIKTFIQKCLAHVQHLRKNRLLYRIVVLGDVLHDHERVHSTALNVAVDFLNALAEIAPTYCLVGNHDYINNSQYLTTNHWMNALKANTRLTIVDKVIQEDWKGKKATLVPYVQPGRFVEALDTCAGWEASNIIFAHQEFKGVKMGSIVSEIGDAWAEELPFVVTGHIHKNQTPQTNIYYPGSAVQVAFGESEKNIVAHVDLDNLTRDGVDEVDLGLQKKKIVYTDVASLKKIAKTIEKGGMYENHKLKVCVDGTKEEFKALKKTAAFKKMQKKGVKLVYKRKRAAITAENMELVNSVQNAKSGMNTFFEFLEKIVHESDSDDLKSAYIAVK